MQKQQQRTHTVGGGEQEGSTVARAGTCRALTARENEEESSEFGRRNIVGRGHGIVEEQRGEERGSRRLGIMYFIMISQQNCNLQQAMSHTTPTPPPSHNASSTPFAPLHARFLCLVHFPSFPFSPPSTHVLSISPTLIISLSLAVSSSLHPPLSSSFPSNRLVSTNQTSLTVDAPAHTCKPSLTSDSKDLLSSNLYLHPPPSRLPPFSLWPPFSPYHSFTVSLSHSVADASTWSFSCDHQPSPVTLSPSRFF